MNTAELEKELKAVLDDKTKNKERLNKYQALLRDLLLIEIGASHIRKGKKLSKIAVSFEQRYDKKTIEKIWSALFDMKVRVFLGMGHSKVIVHFENSTITINAYS